MQNIYIRFLEIIEQYMPNVVEAFGTPVDEKILSELNKNFENKLPKSFLEFYKRANGEKNVIASILGFSLMQIELIKQEYVYLLKNSSVIKSYQKGKIREGNYNKMWLPIASDGGGSFFVMDLDPDKNGIMGQIITLDIENDISYVIADSFRELLLEVIPQELENENFGVDDDDEPNFFEWVDGHYFNGINERF